MIVFQKLPFEHSVFSSFIFENSIFFVLRIKYTLKLSIFAKDPASASGTITK
ncbi:hypothetical protein LEP1GSC055_3628 [Leptospira borgpetersenii str. Brem 307]|uniref:Uncharacterized protein n=1 Tax=Leptospira borgpetersenii str. Brem 328 TaxID=1049780 RepID=A0ABC9SDH1_LEPBO|nr:hypothetical protein LEP1GSC055_3628 [Leptospira borgpetersenii str. Brem 307]EMN15720.1 hypothetical protein LEP1GSC056_4124 [Leptospira borgpetersenii str. Brem 328]